MARQRAAVLGAQLAPRSPQHVCPSLCGLPDRSRANALAKLAYFVTVVAAYAGGAPEVDQKAVIYGQPAGATSATVKRVAADAGLLFGRNGRCVSSRTASRAEFPDVDRFPTDADRAAGVPDISASAKMEGHRWASMIVSISRAVNRMARPRRIGEIGEVATILRAWRGEHRSIAASSATVVRGSCMVRLVILYVLTRPVGIWAAFGIGVLAGKVIQGATIPVFLTLSAGWLRTGWRHAVWQDRMRSRHDNRSQLKPDRGAE